MHVEHALYREQAEAYVGAFQDAARGHYVANVATGVALFDWSGTQLPMTINNGGDSRSFVCSPRVTYGDYLLEELEKFPARYTAPLLRTLVAGVSGLLKLADADRVVHLNNWMVSTNLLQPLDTKHVRHHTEALAQRYGSHVLAFRTMNRRHNDDLMNALTQAGWLMIPSRQVYLIDEVDDATMRKKDNRHDRRLWERKALSFEEMSVVGQQDASRIAHLYRLLYLEKYSHYNPEFTTDFITLTAKIGLIRYLVLRDADGIIQGFGGAFQRGPHMTTPLIGYNTALPQELGLYRLITQMGLRHAARLGLSLHLSSGVSAFKLTRGATAEIEYTAYYIDHLPAARRMPFHLLRAIGNRVAIPLMRKYDL